MHRDRQTETDRDRDRDRQTILFIDIDVVVVVVNYLTTNQRHLGYLSSGNGHLAGRYSTP